MKASEYYMNQILGGSGGGGITPTGEINITENGNYNVTSFASAEVAVPQPSGTKTISITENGTTTEDVAAYASAEITVDVPTGGGGTEAPENDVIFYDYDGTRVYSYSAADFANLTAMPANPDRTADGLTAQGWNWSLADAKAYVAEYGMLDIGQMYITTSGATEIDVEMIDGRLSPSVALYLNGTVEIDWGDNTEVSVLTGTNITGRKTANHTYSNPGKYTVKIFVTDGECEIKGYSYNSCLFYSGSTSDNTNYIYLGLIKQVRIGTGVSAIGDFGLQGFTNMRSVTIPQGVSMIGKSAFQYCYTLNTLIMPSGITNIGSTIALRAYSMRSVSIPDSVDTIASGFFQDCYSLSRCAVPQKITEIPPNAFANNYAIKNVTMPRNISSIGASAFMSAYTLAKVEIPDTVLSIGNTAFSNCYLISAFVVPEGVSVINNQVFNLCYSLKEIHFQPLTPPTLSNTSAFNSIANDCVFYVPAESLEAYQTATNWSTYASQMQGE